MKEENQQVQSITFSANNVSFDMMLVKAGTFRMGAMPEQKGATDKEVPAHKVKLTNDYYIGKTEVTWRLWNAVLNIQNSELDKLDCPVDNVSWDDCNRFILELNKVTGKEFRLPTEAEWEFAARGGRNSKGFIYSGSDTLSNVVNRPLSRRYLFESGYIYNVASCSPNELGIYDMSGNVSEWCYDLFGYYNVDKAVNPVGVYDGEERICRGGGESSYIQAKDECLVFRRNFHKPEEIRKGLGFRLLLKTGDTEYESKIKVLKCEYSEDRYVQGLWVAIQRGHSVLDVLNYVEGGMEDSVSTKLRMKELHVEKESIEKELGQREYGL